VILRVAANRFNCSRWSFLNLLDLIVRVVIRKVYQMCINNTIVITFA
jgi:hypothetical protein